MKILHINTYDGNGGAGRACLRLSKALNEAGMDSKILTFYKFGKDRAILAADNSLFGKGRAIFNIFAERYWSKWLSRSLKTPFSLQWFGRAIHHHSAVREADILHIHWINHGFLTPELITRLERLEKPIVWTFHDSNAFTGGCHVRYGCEHYHHQCGNCPLLKFSGPDDSSHTNWRRKEKAYSKLKFSIIAPSNWMRESIKFSSLLGTRPVQVIPNTIETSVFKPYIKNEAKKIFRIAPEKFVILSGFMPSKNDRHKGTEYLLEALNILSRRADIDPGRVELVIFGNKSTEGMPEFPFKTTFLGTISRDEHLAKCYSAANAFVLPSLEDNLPNTVMESLACATPVVAFRTGGIPDMIKHLENGYLAAYQSAEDIADGLEWLYGHDDQGMVQKAARRTVLEYFSEDIISARHAELYQNLLIT